MTWSRKNQFLCRRLLSSTSTGDQNRRKELALPLAFISSSMVWGFLIIIELIPTTYYILF
jgi:hypothetical protein